MSHIATRSRLNTLSVLTLGIPVIFLFTAPLQAQTSKQLDRMIFEPALIPGASPRPAATAGDNSSLLAFLHAGADMPPASPPKEESAADIEQRLGQYQNTIIQVESDDGAYSGDLIEDLMSLGSLYQQEGDHDKAIEIFDRAQHISRVNYGLFDPIQFPIIEKSIASQMAMGLYQEAMQNQRYLIYLHEKFYGQGDMNTLPSVIHLANQNLDMFSTVIGKKEPVISINFSVGGQGSSPRQTQDPRRMVFLNLFMAQRNYVKAINTMIQNKAFFRPEILQLEYKFLETLFLQANSAAMLDEPNYYLSERSSTVTGSHLTSGFSFRSLEIYTLGKNTFERILIYLRSNPETPPEAIATALVEYGDWHLLFGRNTSAIGRYQEAHDLLLENAVEPQVIDGILSPVIPVQLPLITSKPNSREKFGIPDDRVLEADGYIDVAFTIARHGKVRRIKILDKSGSATNQIERRLKRYLRNSPFRPRFVEDQPARTDRVSLRYYFTYNPET